MDLQLEGKRALVTGGSKGIGKAIARQLAREGCDVVIASRTAADLEATAKELAAETGRKIVAITVDTADDASVKALVEGAAKALGGLDILVNNAAAPGGVTPPPKLAEITEEAFYADVDVKVLGYLRCAREAAPHMIKGGWGRIINISGLAARQTGSIIGSIRNVSVSAITKNLADELGPKGINVTVLHPGSTRTERTGPRLAKMVADSGSTLEEAERRVGAGSSIGRMIETSEIADVVAFLASPRSVSINGDGIGVAGGSKGAIHY
ncbi:MAG: SDR family NAD(P)-dependent oxidoreductase [Phenylobacterium sp.]|uniref:SDR family NAD(P)-dependent oxidoreductase n=1 Tax=Phenylobacterium sp. TaxID=1871053 RepID=UPI002735FA2A|nr:SDR family NAD(P)-dependent oxidoreductase [Phenylobacterium sp.]MDP3174390.1 SDR family NAD(P)-dependent oxidoreductase [Phenylobacterium sp.]